MNNQADVVRVCPERDIECGRNPKSWCATCANRATADLAVCGFAIKIDPTLKENEMRVHHLHDLGAGQKVNLSELRAQPLNVRETKARVLKGRDPKAVYEFNVQPTLNFPIGTVPSARMMTPAFEAQTAKRAETIRQIRIILESEASSPQMVERIRTLINDCP